MLLCFFSFPGCAAAQLSKHAPCRPQLHRQAENAANIACHAPLPHVWTLSISDASIGASVSGKIPKFCFYTGKSLPVLACMPQCLISPESGCIVEVVGAAETC
jgi:hypothetical protein